MNTALRVLVTGAGGQVGSDVVRRGAAVEGLALVPVDRASLDIGNPDQVRAAFDLHRPDLVINCAAYTAVDRAESEPDQAHAINRDGVAHLAGACREQGAPLLHLSTDYVFDGSGETPWTPEAPTAPLGVYGASKLAGEQVLRDTLPQHLTLRTSWVFGEQGANFVRTMVRLANERDTLRVVDDQVGGPTWSGHIADALLALAVRFRDQRDLPWGTWHYAGQPWVTWHAFATATVAEAHRLGLVSRMPAIAAITTAEFPTPARRPHNSRLDMASTTQALGLAPPDWHAGLRAVLEAWRT